MPRSVICAHCGAENPDSPIITVCGRCRQGLADAKRGSEPAPPPHPAPAPASRPSVTPERHAAPAEPAPPGAEARPQGQPQCPRCGQAQEAGRGYCRHCGMHFVGPGAAAPGRLSRSQATPGGNTLQRTALVVLGCMWAGFGLFILLIILLALVGR